MTNSKQQLGKRGEHLAASFLEQHGYDLITTNWRCTIGELDIIAQEGHTLVFVEVRTRRAVSAALESITPAKRQKLIDLAHTYLTEHSLPDNTLWRIDVIAIEMRSGYKPRLEHIEDALGW